MPDITETLAATASAVSGTDTPAAASVSRRPPTGAVWTLFAGLGAMLVVVGFVIAVLAFHPWPEAVADDRIKYLGFIGLGALLCAAVIVCAIASPFVGKIDASAGPAHLGISRD